jgi:hypothetical protein
MKGVEGEEDRSHEKEKHLGDLYSLTGFKHTGGGLFHVSWDERFLGSNFSFAAKHSLLQLITTALWREGTLHGPR